MVNGVEKKRDRKSQTVIKEPVEEIIEVGTKKTGVETKETVTVEEKVAFKEETKVDQHWIKVKHVLKKVKKVLMKSLMK